ncbi:MAG: hypothetical protein E6253_06465 [Actinomyces sp.]|nr:hypothetical protein [Actinomyces sp.]
MQPIARNLEAKINRHLAVYADTKDIDRLVSNAFRDIIDAVNDLETARALRPHELSQILESGGENLISSEMDLVDQPDLNIIKDRSKLPKLDLATVPKFWVCLAPAPHETIPSGLADLGINRRNGQRRYNTPITIDTNPTSSEAPVVYLGTIRVGTTPKRQGRTIHQLAINTGSRYVTIDSTIMITNGHWQILIKGTAN